MADEAPRGEVPEPESTGSVTSDASFAEWIREQVDAQPYWFHKIRITDELATPGWSDPAVEKLPYFGLPESLEGLRVLDVGTAEGFFSFEAERRGAAEVVGIDSFPDSVERFNIVRAALGSKVTIICANVYDLSRRCFGSFDLVLFYGVLYHLRHPLLALQKILEVADGTLLVQTLVDDEIPSREPLARFFPSGLRCPARWFNEPAQTASSNSGGPGSNAAGTTRFDPTVFWVPNRECVRAMLTSVGFTGIETVCDGPDLPFVLRASSPRQRKGKPPDQHKAPWS